MPGAHLALVAQVMTNPWFPDIDDLAARIEHLARAPEAAPLRSTMLFYHTYLHILRGQKEAAQATIGELDRLAQSLGDPPFLRLLATIVSTVSVNLLDGDWDGTVAWPIKAWPWGPRPGFAFLTPPFWARRDGPCSTEGGSQKPVPRSTRCPAMCPASVPGTWVRAVSQGHRALSGGRSGRVARGNPLRPAAAETGRIATVLSGGPLRAGPGAGGSRRRRGVSALGGGAYLWRSYGQPGHAAALRSA